MPIHVLVLNYNGRRLLSECLPSVLAAAQKATPACRVSVIDNSSTDDSVAYLTSAFPHVPISRRPNRGLCSFNDVLAELAEPVAVLLNNDIKLAPDCLDRLAAPLLGPQSGPSSCFMTAPLCWQFDGRTYEGFKTAVCWRWGLVQATALFPRHEQRIAQAGWTASAGAALAVDRRKFLALGGFDPLYLPGRLEDLDFAFRGYQAGYHARYVPEAVAYHLGMGTFGPVFGREGCDRLALRNTLLFQWKNLRHPWHRLRHGAGLAARLMLDACRGRQTTLHALQEAWQRWQEASPTVQPGQGSLRREWDFFRRFHPRYQF
jgi:GT2 family glycosyltransferase